MNIKLLKSEYYELKNHEMIKFYRILIFHKILVCVVFRSLMDIDTLNDPKHTFVIAEAGSNWKCGTYEEDLDMATKLIESATKCGADAIKFQTYRSHTVYAPNAGESDYLADQGFKKDINEIFDYLSMPYKMIPELSLICKKEGIDRVIIVTGFQGNMYLEHLKNKTNIPNIEFFKSPRFAESGDVGWMEKNQGRNIQKSIDVKQVNV